MNNIKSAVVIHCILYQYQHLDKTNNDSDSTDCGTCTLWSHSSWFRKKTPILDSLLHSTDICCTQYLTETWRNKWTQIITDSIIQYW